MKSTENDRTAPFPASARAASAVTALESSPPDSSVHSGTSEMSCRSMMSSSSSRTVLMVVCRSSVCSRPSSRQ